MRRLWIAIAIVLMLSGQVWAAKQSNEIADITYLLRCWPTGYTVPDQSYTNGQVIDTAAEGCLDGSLTVTDTGTGSVSSLSNIITVVGESSWTTPLLASTSIARTLGLAYFSTYASGNSSYASPNRVCSGSTCTSNYIHLDFRTGNILALIQDGTYIYPAIGSFSASTTYYLATVLGGYSVGGVPYKSGDTKSDFKYGVTYFIKGGAEYPNYTRLFSHNFGVTSPLYFGAFNYSGTFGVSNLLIPNYDFSAVLQPTFLDTFTGADGTSLADHTPDVGGAWTDIDGNSTLFSNYFGIYGGDSAGRIKSGYIDTGISSQFISANIYVRRYDDSNRFKGGVKVRYQDSSNYFDVLHYGQSAGTRLSIVEYPAVVERAYWQNSSFISEYYNGYGGTLPTNIINAPSYISMFVGTTASVTYSSSTLNDKTKVAIHVDKIGSVDNNGYIDNFAVWPLTSATYTSEFAKVGY